MCFEFRETNCEIFVAENAKTDVLRLKTEAKMEFLIQKSNILIKNKRSN